MKHRLFSILLVAVTLTTCLFGLGITAMAATTEYGDFLVETTVEEGCSYSDKILTISKGGIYTVSMKEGVTTTADTIVINAEEVKLTLNNVQIASDTQNRPALTLKNDASLEAQGTVSLTGHTGGNDITAAISGQGKTLTFLGGELKAQGGSGKMANYYDAEDGASGIQANVVVEAGTLEATGGNGSELYATFNGRPGGTGILGDVRVEGGTLEATGGNGGDSPSNAGDGGSGIVGKVIKVNGGTLIAKGGDGGSDDGGMGGHGGHGIGLTAYNSSTSYNVTVNGGAVSATGGNGGDGSSYDEGRGEGGNGVSNCTVQINRGTLTSLAGDPGSGAVYSFKQYFNRAFNNQSPTTATTDRDVKLWVGSSPSNSKVADNYDSEKYAKYQVRMIYALRFEGLDGADDVYLPTSITEGESIVIPNVSKANYHFLGWQINDAAQPVKNLTLEGDQYTETITLTALWQEKETFPLTSQPQTYTYSGQPQSYTLDSTVTNVTVEYRVNGSFVEQAPVDAGSYDVKLTRPEDDTYKSFEKTLFSGLVINRAEPVVVAPTVKTGLVYSGQPQALVTPGTTSGGTMVYCINGGEWSEEIPSATEVGIYAIAYQVIGDANYKSIAVNALPTVTIREKDPFPLTALPQTYTYNGQPLSYVLSSSVTNVTVEYRVNGSFVEQAPVDAGSYDVKLTRPEDDTYKAFETTLVAGLMIHPADPVVTPPTAKTGLVYTGQAKTLVNPGSAQGGTVLYRVNDGAWSEEIPSATEVGTYQIAYQVVGDSNHNNIGDKALPAVEILPSITVCPKDQTCPIHPYADAKPSAWYHDGVHYCIAEGLIKGYDTGLLGPNDVASRGQVVTLLWRAAGSPKPETTDCPFTDVEPSAFYYEAMLWAVEQGITKGTSETTFAPNEICTRSQVVTFLWRAAGSPKPGTEACPFTDVKSDSFYSEAMLWAVEQGITTGTTPTTFQPLKSCTRAEIATFLYRYGG